MKVLLIGGGGREHALAWKLAGSARVTKIFAAPGNPGIAATPKCVGVPTAANDITGLLKLARQESIDLTVVGPEEPLAAGVVDRFREAKLKVFGPTREAARIESDKAFAKEIMRQQGIPTAEGRTFTRTEDAVAYIRSRIAPPVVKATGLAKGKGVVVPATPQEAEQAVRDCLEKKIHGSAGQTVLLEERLIGREVSVLAICDGDSIYVLPPCQDHKPVGDGDKGPNTGGMGAVCPSTAITPELMAEIEAKVLVPAVHGLRLEGERFVGVLYAGLMLTRAGPKVLEFNARFGDPETQPLMLRLRSDLAEVLLAAVDGRLDEIELDWDPRPAVSVVMASRGYPVGPVETGKAIQGLARLPASPELMVFHSGTTMRDGWVETAGGRVLAVTALGADLADARRRAYSALELLRFDGAHWRSDIGVESASASAAAPSTSAPSTSAPSTAAPSISAPST